MPPDSDRTATHAEVVEAESVRDVARCGRTRISQTRYGSSVNAGVDTSNVDKDIVALPPLNPEASARALRTGLHDRLDVDVDVDVDVDIDVAVAVVADTFGRPCVTG